MTTPTRHPRAVRVALAAAALTAAGPTGPLGMRAVGAQPPTAGPLPSVLRTVDPGTVPALRRPVTLALRAVPLDAALAAIAAQADVSLTFSRDILPPGHRVTLAARDMLAGDALRAVLADAGLEILALSSGQVVVVRAGAAQPGAATQPRVRLSGYVRSAATREVVRHATVNAERVGGDGASPAAGGSQVTESNADGVYFLRLAPGAHRLRARAIGFAPLDTVVVLDPARTLDRPLDLALLPRATLLTRVEVTAVANRPAADPRSPAMSVARLDLTTVRQVPAVLGEIDPMRSLALLPGVSRASDFTTSFNVRGGSADQNLVLLDESTIYNPAHVLGFLSVFNGDAVDDVTLYTGAIPVRYGGRLSSVVDVRQRAGNANRLGGSATLGLLASRVALEGPLPGRPRPAAGRDDRAADRRGSFLVAARRSYADLFTRAARDPAVRDNVAYFYDANGKATMPVGRSGTVALSGYLGRDRFRTTDALGAAWGNRAATLRWDQIAGGRLLSTLTVAGSDYDYRLRFAAGGDAVDWVAGIRSVDARIDETLSLAGGDVVGFGAQLTGLGFRPGDLRARGEAGAGAGRRIESRGARSGGVYLDHEHTVGPRVSVRYGARLSTFERRGPGTVYRYANGRPVAYDSTLGRFEPSPVLDSTRVGRGATIARYAAFEPRASLRVGVGRDASLKASYARTAQYLHLASRTNAPTPLDVWEPSGRDLRPQRGDQLAVGYAAVAAGGAVELSAEAYVRRLTNVVDFIDGVDLVLNPRPEAAIVQGRGRAAGLELYARRRTAGGWMGRTTGWASYTLSRAEQRFGDVTGGLAGGVAGADAKINGGRWYRAPFDKTHDLSVVALHPVGRGWTFGATFALASGLPATYPTARYQIDGLLVPEFGPRNAARLPLYHRLDLGLTRAGRRGELQLGVVNVYNRYNAQSISFRQSERNPLVAQAVQLSVFGIVPSVSYTRRF